MTTTTFSASRLLWTSTGAAAFALLTLPLWPAHGMAARRLPIEFDIQLAENPTLVQSKLDELLSKTPAWYSLPEAWVDSLESGPDGTTVPTVQLWLFHEARAQMLRNRDVGSAAMVWPAAEVCHTSIDFVLTDQSLLAPAAVSECGIVEDSVRHALRAETVGACADLELPERYVLASRLPDGLTDSERTAFVRDHTTTLEDQIALAGAGFATTSPPEGLLPDDFVPVLRSLLWKIRATPLQRPRAAQETLTHAFTLLNDNASCFDPERRGTLLAQLGLLRAELDEMIDAVAATLSESEQRAARQTQCLAASGRTRPVLPYPAMTDEEREFLGFWLGAVYWRMRGAALIKLDGTTSYRTLYAQRSLREIAHMANGTPASEKAADAITCNLLDGWGEWFDMGTNQDPAAPAEDTQDGYYDLVKLTNRGRQQVVDFPVGSVLCGLLMGVDRAPATYLEEAGYDTRALVTAGLSMGPCYLYALNPLKMFRYYPLAEAQPPYMYFIDGFTSTGEVCFGGSLGLGLTRSLLHGSPSGQPPTAPCQDRECGEDPCGNRCGDCGGGAICNEFGHCLTPGASDGAVSSDGGGDSDGWTVNGGDIDAVDDGTGPGTDSLVPPPGGCQCSSGIGFRGRSAWIGWMILLLGWRAWRLRWW